MELLIRWDYYPAHSTPGLILQRPVDIIDAHPERRARPPDIRELVMSRYGVTCRA